MKQMSSSPSLPPALSAKLEETIDKHLPDLIDLRRDLHRHPELSWGETRTTALVRERLEAAGYSIRMLPATGLIADLGDRGPLVALRADLDALPVQDRTEDPWTSQTPGVAHACGHDLHTTALVGAGLALAGLHQADLLPGRIRLLFQPAEEVMPGGALQAIGQAGACDFHLGQFGHHQIMVSDPEGHRAGEQSSNGGLLE